MRSKVLSTEFKVAAAMAGNVTDVVNVVNVRIVASQDGLPVASFQFSEKYAEDSQISQDSSNSSDSQVDFVNLANRWGGRQCIAVIRYGPAAAILAV